MLVLLLFNHFTNETFSGVLVVGIVFVLSLRGFKEIICLFS